VGDVIAAVVDTFTDTAESSVTKAATDPRTMLATVNVIIHRLAPSMSCSPSLIPCKAFLDEKNGTAATIKAAVEG